MALRINHQIINYWLLAGVLIVYPFSLKGCNALIIILTFHWIIWLVQDPGVFNWKNRVLYLMMASYVLCAVSLSYSSNLKAGIFVLDKKFPLLVLPLVIGTIPVLSKRLFDRLMMIAIASVLVAEVMCLSVAFLNFLTKKSGGFFWTDLTIPLDNFHPSYLSLYINFLIFYLGTQVLKNWEITSRRSKLAVGALLVALLFFLILLSSKIQVINAGIISLFLLYKSKRFFKKRVLTAVLIAALLIVSLFIKFTYTGERFFHIATLKYQLDASPKTFNEFTIRLALAECSWEIIKANALLGVGAGDVFDELEKVYYKYDYKFGYLDKQNPHNEYLSQILATGIPGIIVFLLVLMLCVKEALARNEHVYLTLLLLFSSYFLFESMLERHRGIVLFAFFNSLFFFHGFYSKQASSHDSGITT